VKEASYLKISTYTKSVKRYKRERERRRQVRLLAEKGFTQKQIASELGVCARTVKRDWDKIRSYVKGQCRREIRAVVDARLEEFERRYEGLTVNEEFKLLKQDVKGAAKKARALQTSPRRQEQHPQPIRQIDYAFDRLSDSRRLPPCNRSPSG
jgi:predicted transcriptional regulator